MMDSDDEISGAPQANLVSSNLPAKSLPILVAIVVVSAFFIAVVRDFLIALTLAGICAVLARPLYLKLKRLAGGREGLASALTLSACMIAVFAPLLFITYQAAIQAVELFGDSEQLLDSLSQDVQELKEGTLQLPKWVPFRQELASAGPQLVEKINELLGTLARFFASSLSSLTNGTASFFISLFAFLYALFFMLSMKTSVFSQFLAYSGLPQDLQQKLDERIISVSRATIKGSLLIGVAQGSLGGLGFWIVGFEGAIFWAVIMAILAAIPALGATPVLFVGASYLGIEGEITKAVGLALWAMLVVGSIDNVLRPWLVGKGAGMSDLWIFVSTLGGLGAFGAPGLVLGPVVAGLFITIWSETAGSKPYPDGVVGEDEVAETDVSTTAASAANTGGLKLTATKAEMEAELSELKRQLEERDS